MFFGWAVVLVLDIALKSRLYANQFGHKVGNESWTRPTFTVG